MKEWLKPGAELATIIAAIVASLALGFGFFQFKSTLELQKEESLATREATAVGLYLDYLKHVRESQEKPPDLSLTLTVAEHIFEWNGDDSGWRNTVARMITDNSAALKKDRVDCRTITCGFKKFLIKTLKENMCEQEKPCPNEIADDV